MNRNRNILTWKLGVPCWLLVIAFITILLEGIFSTHLHAQIPTLEFSSKPNECVLYNSNNQKMYYYYRLDPQEELAFSVTNVDSIEIYSRLFYDSDEESLSYNYVISIEGTQDTTHKTCRLSAVTRGVDGQLMSSYNKKIIFLNEDSEVSVKNISRSIIVFKFDYNAPNKYTSQLEYIAYSPDNYSDEKVLIVKDTEYTYYEPDNDIIELDLFGPVFLKIISRTIFHNPATRKMDYQFSVYDNNELMTSYNETAYQSSQSIFPHDIEQIPSTGDVNILQFDKGSHHIQIRDNTNNHSVIFRLYINKTAVYVGDK